MRGNHKWSGFRGRTSIDARLRIAPSPVNVALGGRQRRGEQEALRELAAERCGRRQLLLGLDPLGHGDQRELAGRSDGTARDCQVRST